MNHIPSATTAETPLIVTALDAALSFVIGFEDDTLQEGIADLLTLLRSAREVADEQLCRTVSAEAEFARFKTWMASQHGGGAMAFIDAWREGRQQALEPLRKPLHMEMALPAGLSAGARPPATDAEIESRFVDADAEELERHLLTLLARRHSACAEG